MKKIRNLLMMLAAFCNCFLFNPMDIEAKPYTYTVSFYAGEQGGFSNLNEVQVRKLNGNSASVSVDSDSNKIQIKGLEFGDVVSLNAQAAVSLKDNSKYYVKGIRLSGRDNRTVSSSVFKVVEDQDYVVAYGIAGDLTEYTVNYVDENGNKIAESRKYFGNVGDEPVLAYLYIDGYVPEKYSIKQKLSSNQEENIFNFTYLRINPDNNGNTDNGNNGDNAGDGNGAGGNNAGAGNGAGGNNAGNGNGNGAGANNAGAGNGNNAGNGADGNNPDNGANGNQPAGQPNVIPDENVPQGPPDPVDEVQPNTIEDTDVPLSSNSDRKDPERGFSFLDLIAEKGIIVSMVVGTIALAAAGFCTFRIIRLKKSVNKEVHKDDKN